MKKISVIGERVVVKPIEIELEGKIVVPQTIQKQWEIGEVMHVGNMRRPDGTSATAYVKKGDLVMLQYIGAFEQGSRFEIGGKHVRIVHQNDLVGRLASVRISYDTFEPLGRYVLLKPESGLKSTIVVPQDFQPAETMRFVVKKTGSAVEQPVVPGMEAFPERGHLNRMALGEEVFVFCDQQWIFAVTEAASS